MEPSSITKTAQIVGVKQYEKRLAATNQQGEVVDVPAVELTIVLGAGTAGEQHPVFMILESDYAALGRPGYGDTVNITLSYPVLPV